MADRVQGEWECTPPPSPGWADFTIMMECTSESGYCHSVCTLWSSRVSANVCVLHIKLCGVGGGLLTLHLFTVLFTTLKSRQRWVVVRRTNAVEWISWPIIMERQKIFGILPIIAYLQVRFLVLKQ
jgi:hypothetical protein